MPAQKVDAAKLKAAFSQIEKQHGPGTVFRLGGSRKLVVEVIPSNVMPIDKATGVGGFPRGRIVEIFGPNAGGKTTLTLQVIAEAQKNFGPAAFVDAEHALDPNYARKLGVDVDNLIVSQPDNGEQALEVAETLISSEQFAVVVVDSVAALVPKKELEGEMGDSQMGSQARLMSQAMRKLNAAVARTKTCLIFINQIRMKIGTMYGNPETTTGGEALKFFSSMRVSVRPGQGIKQGDQQIGCDSKVKIVKNKLASPFKEAEPVMIYGQGFDPITNNLPVLVELGIITKSGNFFDIAGEKRQGKDNAIEYLQENLDVYAKLYAAGREALLKPPTPASQPTATQEETEELPDLASLEALADQEEKLG